MDQRFSTLFLQPPRTPPQLENTTMSGALPDSKGLARRKSTMKSLLRKLFGIPRQMAVPSIKIREPVPSKLSQQVWSESSSIMEASSSTTRSTKRFSTMSTNSAVVVHPRNLPPSTRRQSIFHKSSSSTSSLFSTNKRSSTYSTTSKTRDRDSKFSSISSLPSIATLSLYPQPHHTSPGPTISLSIEELALLQSLIRRIARQLKKQEYLTNHLAGNLVHLFARKEAQIHAMKRARVQEREMAAREVWRLRETVGRGFLRRGVLVGRSEGALTLLRTALDNATRAPSTPPTTTRQSSALSLSSLSRTSSPSSYTTATSTSKSDCDSASSSTTPRSSISVSKDALPTFSLPLHTLHDTTSTLSSDLALHSILNSELKTQIYTSCLSSRWNGLPGGGMNGNLKGSISDKIMMHRFVSFVDIRVQMMEDVDARLAVLVAAVEKVGKRKGTEKE